MIPMHTEAGKYHCLLFYVSNTILMLEPRLKRYQAIKRLAVWLDMIFYGV